MLKSKILDRVRPQSRGLASVAPKKTIPVAVVIQSKKPTETTAHNKKSLVLNIAQSSVAHLD